MKTPRPVPNGLPLGAGTPIGAQKLDRERRPTTVTTLADLADEVFEVRSAASQGLVPVLRHRIEQWRDEMLIEAGRRGYTVCEYDDIVLFICRRGPVEVTPPPARLEGR